MEGFLHHILSDIQVRDLPALSQHCYVFPTRRAGMYFRKFLTTKFKEYTFWSPTILSIEDFVQLCTGKAITDDITLLFELFTVYKKYDPEMSFDNFYSWGHILLKDFDEIDRYLVEAELLYSNLQDISDIEVEFADQEEILHALAQFKKIIQTGPDSMLKQEFAKNWQLVKQVYFGFKSHLNQKGLSYGGMLYRELSNGLVNEAFDPPFDLICFCGFNALSKSEELLFDQLIRINKVRLYWDADAHYLEDDQQEAGRFLRRYRKKWSGPESRWIINQMVEKPKDIQVIGVVQSVGQAKVAGGVLHEKLNPEKTAVVLADENLLFPLLYSLPQDLQKVNVTMGYPLRNSGLYTLSLTLVKFQVNKRGQEKKAYLFAEDLVSFLKIPHVQSLAPQQCVKMLTWIAENNLRWIKTADIESHISHNLILKILEPTSKVKDFLTNLALFLTNLTRQATPQMSQDSEFNQEIIFQFVKQLKQLTDKLSHFEINLSFSLLAKLLKEAFQQARVPFTGEPIIGLQIMGFLETRALDFENVIILSVNENKLPSSNFGNTYIPYSLRKTFGLPTYQTLDAIYGYHFNRLLQRAKTVYLLYDTEVAVDGSGEKSRFILQLINSFENSTTVKVTQSIYSTQFKLAPAKEDIQIQKSGKILKILKKYLVGGDKVRFLGPTAITTYLDCSLRFYLRYVAEIKENETYHSDMGPKEFGIIVHDLLESLYSEYQGKKLSKEDLDNMSDPKHIQEHLTRKLVERNFLREDQVLEGRNLLNQSIIRDLVKKVVQNDKRRLPFSVMAIESKEFSYQLPIEGGKEVKLGGMIDRIDQAGGSAGLTTIIDYKTGIVDLLPLRKSQEQNISEYIGYYFDDGKYRSGFQGLYYALLVHHALGVEPLQVGIYKLQKVNAGISELRQGGITQAMLMEFENRLKSLITEIFNPDIPFIETEDKTKCDSCPYATICSKA